MGAGGAQYRLLQVGGVTRVFAYDGMDVYVEQSGQPTLEK